jgi:Electron transfer DM13
MQLDHGSRTRLQLIWRQPPTRRNGMVMILLAVVLLAAWTEPWKLLARRTFHEAAPEGARTIAMGKFIGHVHHAAGTARLVVLPDNKHLLRVEGLRTTQGPRVHVWLIDRRIDHATASRHTVKTVAHVDLGPMRANRGDANYLLPDDARITSAKTAILWCARFRVVFGFAPLDDVTIAQATRRR